LLLIALLSLPYFYYQLMRWAICGCAGYIAYKHYKEKGCGVSGRTVSSAKGLTLVELLIAAALLGLVSLGFGFIYVVAQRNLVRNANFVVAQNEAAYAMEHIKRQLARAVFLDPVSTATDLRFDYTTTMGAADVTARYVLNGNVLEYREGAGAGVLVENIATNATTVDFNIASPNEIWVVLVIDGGVAPQPSRVEGTVSPRGIPG